MEMSGVSNRLLTAQVLLLWDTVTRLPSATRRVSSRVDDERTGPDSAGLRAAAPRAKKIAVGSVRKTLTSTARARGDASP